MRLLLILRVKFYQNFPINVGKWTPNYNMNSNFNPK